MAINGIRQQAPKAPERVARLRPQRADLVKQHDDLAAVVMMALAERDALLTRRNDAAIEQAGRRHLIVPSSVGGMSGPASAVEPGAATAVGVRYPLLPGV